MTSCDSARRTLTETAPERADLPAGILEHLESCAECQAFAARLQELDKAFAALGDHDAPDALVDRTLKAVRAAKQTKTSAPVKSKSNYYIAGGLAASLVIAALLGIAFNLPDGSMKTAQLEPPASVTAELSDEAGSGLTDSLNETFEAEAGVGAKWADGNGLLDAPGAESPIGELDIIAQLAQEDLKYSPDDLTAKKPSAERVPEEDQGEGFYRQDGEAAEPLSSLENTGREPLKREARPESAEIEQKLKEDRSSESDAFTLGLQTEDSEEKPLARDDGVPGRSRSLHTAPERNRQLAESFLEGYRSLQGLSFQDPVGYWSNSYVPGDRQMRILKARIDAWKESSQGRDFQVLRHAEVVEQPFDAPEDAALGLFVSAERKSIVEKSRLRLQVGIKGAERQGGHRPTMNVALILDLRDGVDLAAGRKIRALVEALAQAKRSGDRFSLSLAGPGGGLLILPEDFRQGSLQAALEDILSRSPGPTQGDESLAKLLAETAQNLSEGDDPQGVLGSSLLLLVTGSSLDGEIQTLERLAFENALKGLPLSVIGLSAMEDPGEVERLVKAGQGNRRILSAPGDAVAIVDKELHAASRAVARALRLRIHLAPGVKLVDVLGAERLDLSEAQRVRQAESAIDQRLARNLGIEADRGEDEEGIQIVIPKFQAGDSHVILLDLVAEGPGPLADVTLRYKDVVRLKNAVARTGISLESGDDRAGPLQLNVLKNLLAWEFSRQSRIAARYLQQGDGSHAFEVLLSLKSLLQGLREVVPGWSSDPDLIADEDLLASYLEVLRRPRAAEAAERRYLADSLRYDSLRKLQTAQR